jgi:hypothetical protein
MIEQISIGKLNIDFSYQRTPAANRLEAIVKNYDPLLMQVLEVSRRADGSLYVIDGQHRMMAARQKFGEDHQLSCRIHQGLTVAQEAKMFVDLQRKRKSILQVEQFKANLIAGDPLTVSIQRILEGLNLRVQGGGNPGAISAAGALVEVARENGLEALSKALITINSAWGREGKCYARQFIRGLGKLYAVYPELSLERMVKQIRPELPANIERQAHIINGGTSTRGGNTLIPYGLAFLHFYNKSLRSGKIDGKRLTGGNSAPEPS